MHDPKLHATTDVVTKALLEPGQRSAAQNASELETRFEAGAVTYTLNGAQPLSAFALTPAVRFANPRLTASATASAWLNADRWQLGAAAANLEMYMPLAYGFRAEFDANADRAVRDFSTQNDQLDAEARLHYMRQRGGMWLGTGIARPLRVAAVSNVNVSSGGVWTNYGPATLRGTVTSFLFTKVASRDSIEGTPLCTSRVTATPAADAVSSASTEGVGAGCRHTSRLTDVEGSVRFQHHLMELTVRGGQRFGDRLDVSAESRQWASGQAAVWVSSQLAAVAGGGREPAQPTRGLPARSYGSLGLMLAYWPIPRGTVPVETPASMVHAFAFRSAGPNLQRITARIGGVESVEIMGDFSDWQPIPLIRRGRDLWELLVPLGAGVHQINLRIDDGQWIAPPGIPTLRDGFNGEVGVLVIPS
jgi:hypothetical protein